MPSSSPGPDATSLSSFSSHSGVWAAEGGREFKSLPPTYRQQKPHYSPSNTGNGDCITAPNTEATEAPSQAPPQHEGNRGPHYNPPNREVTEATVRSSPPQKKPNQTNKTKQTKTTEAAKATVQPLQRRQEPDDSLSPLTVLAEAALQAPPHQERLRQSP